MPIALVPIAEIANTRSVQLRPINLRWYQHLADEYQRGCRFPPLSAFYDGKRYWLWDGFHRFNVYRFRTDLTEVEVDWEPGDKSAAMLAAARANTTHGLPRQGYRHSEYMQTAAVLRATKSLYNSSLKKRPEELDMAAIGRFADTTPEQVAKVLEWLWRWKPVRRKKQKKSHINKVLRNRHHDWAFFNQRTRARLREKWLAAWKADRAKQYGGQPTQL